MERAAPRRLSEEAFVLAYVGNLAAQHDVDAVARMPHRGRRWAPTSAPRRSSSTPSATTRAPETAPGGPRRDSLSPRAPLRPAGAGLWHHEGRRGPAPPPRHLSRTLRRLDRREGAGVPGLGDSRALDWQAPPRALPGGRRLPPASRGRQRGGRRRLATRRGRRARAIARRGQPPQRGRALVAGQGRGPGRHPRRGDPAATIATGPPGPRHGNPSGALRHDFATTSPRILPMASAKSPRPTRKPCGSSQRCGKGAARRSHGRPHAIAIEGYLPVPPTQDGPRAPSADTVSEEAEGPASGSPSLSPFPSPRRRRSSRASPPASSPRTRSSPRAARPRASGRGSASPRSMASPSARARAAKPSSATRPSSRPRSPRWSPSASPLSTSRSRSSTPR